MSVSVTQYDLMSTSTCNPLGGGSSRCSYEYRKEVSTTTTLGSSTVPEFTAIVSIPDNVGTSTNYFNNVGAIGVFVFIAFTFAIVVGTIVKKVT